MTRIITMLQKVPSPVSAFFHPAMILYVLLPDDRYQLLFAQMM